MPQEKIHVGARVPKDIVDKCLQKYGNMTSAINIALELLTRQDENKDIDSYHQNEIICQHNENSIELIELKIRMEEKDNRLRERYEQITTKDNLHEARIHDLLDQLKVKDQQLEKKDIQIQNLTETMQSQALNIHNLINQKAVEAPGKKKWWRFW
jgi:hypothetical protein